MVVPARDPLLRVHVGWDRDRESYTLSAYDVEGLRPDEPADESRLVASFGFYGRREFSTVATLVSVSLELVDWAAVPAADLVALVLAPAAVLIDLARQEAAMDESEAVRDLLVPLLERLAAQPPSAA